MKRFGKAVQEGLARLATAAGAGSCEDVGGGTCDGDKCKDCHQISEACEWIWQRIGKADKKKKLQEQKDA